MPDLHPMMPSAVLGHLEASGRLDALTPSQREAWARPEGVSWKEFAELLSLCERVFPDRDALVEDLAAGYLTLPGLMGFRRLVRVLAGPVAAYRLMDRMGPRTSPIIESEFEVVGTNRIRIRLFVGRESEVSCPLYFDITGALLARIPEEMMGLPRAEVVVENLGTEAVYRILTPRSWSIFARVSAAWQAFWGTHEMLDLIGEEQAMARALHHRNSQLREHSEKKSRHLADMSHELRTPLNAIIGYSELLGEEVRDAGLDELVPDLDRIETAAHYLLRLINGVLDLSKIEAGRLDVRSERLELRALVDEVAVALEPVVTGGGSALLVEGPGSCQAMGDGHRVRQILTNLVGNAAKFTKQGRIVVRLVPRDPWADIEVEDSGVGIPAEALETLFDPYRQASSSTAEQFGGTGLGLSIALGLAELMGGELTVRSTLGEGSTFTLRLPV